MASWACFWRSTCQKVKKMVKKSAQREIAGRSREQSVEKELKRTKPLCPLYFTVPNPEFWWQLEESTRAQGLCPARALVPQWPKIHSFRWTGLYYPNLWGILYLDCNILEGYCHLFVLCIYPDSHWRKFSYQQPSSFYELFTRLLQIPVQFPWFLAVTDWYQAREHPLRRFPLLGTGNL